MDFRSTRRQFVGSGLTLAGLGLLAGCGVLSAPPAQRARPRRIGMLIIGGPVSHGPLRDAFRQGLQELGYVEGGDVVLEERYAEGREERLPALAAELVQLDVDLILTHAAAGIRAAGQATSTIPIVFATASADPVADGLVASLARPGGNMTGLTILAGEEHAKRLQLLKEAFPNLSRVAVLRPQSNPNAHRETAGAAQTLGVQVLSLELRSPDELDAVLAGVSNSPVDGLVVTSGPVFTFLAPRIVVWATEHHLPAMYGASTFVESGGLMVYAANNQENWRRAAGYVDRILKGASPAALPVEKPTKFDFVVNLRAAQAIGLTIPQTILAQATEIIQ